MTDKNLSLWWNKIVPMVRDLIKSKNTAAFWTADELRTLRPACEDLSDGLTKDRALIGRDYFADPELRAAYLALYWPVTYAQAQMALKVGGCTVKRGLDLGCGTGAFGAALLDAGAERLTACDTSAAALEQAEALLGSEVFWHKESLADLRLRGDYDAITVGNVINEIGLDADKQVELVQRWMRHLTPTGRLILVEPALKDTSRALLGLRDRIAADYRIEAPCIWSGACPALDDPKDWCHGGWPWTPPDMVAQLADEVGVRRDHIKMSYLVLSNGEPRTQGGRVARVVSEPRHTKGRLRYFVCGSQGRIPLVCPEKLAKKNDALSPMKYLPKGAVVEYGATQTKGDGEVLLKDSSVSITHDADVAFP